MRSTVWPAMLAIIVLGGCKRPPTHPYANLNASTLQALPDAKLEDAVMDYIESKVGNDYSTEYQTVTGLPKGCQVIYTTVAVEAEVNNGGFNQYFWNTDGKFRGEAVEGFKQLGANAHAELMEEAVDIYEKNKETLKKFKEKGTTQAFSDSYNDNPLNACDDKFYKLKDNLGAMRVRYIRGHPELFFGQ